MEKSLTNLKLPDLASLHIAVSNFPFLAVVYGSRKILNNVVIVPKSINQSINQSVYFRNGKLVSKNSLYGIVTTYSLN